MLVLDLKTRVSSSIEPEVGAGMGANMQPVSLKNEIVDMMVFASCILVRHQSWHVIIRVSHHIINNLDETNSDMWIGIWHHCKHKTCH